MKANQFIPAALLSLTLYACQTDNRESTQDDDTQVNTEEQTPVKLIEYLIGEWELQDNGGAGQQANANERLTFTVEARYIAYSGGLKVDSGAYRMNEQLRNLYLESEATERPREYEIELQQDVMTLTPRQQQDQRDQAQQGQSEPLTYRRVGEASVPPDKRGQ